MIRPDLHQWIVKDELRKLRLNLDWTMEEELLAVGNLALCDGARRFPSRVPGLRFGSWIRKRIRGSMLNALQHENRAAVLVPETTLDTNGQAVEPRELWFDLEQVCLDAGLSPLETTVVNKAFVDGWSTRDVARLVGAHMSTVQKRKVTAVNKLRDYFTTVFPRKRLPDWLKLLRPSGRRVEPLD